MRSRRAEDYAIWHREGLAKLLNRFIKEIGGGSEAVAARTIGISQPTLNRYRNRKRATMSRRVANAIFDALLQMKEPEQMSRRFIEVVLNPRAATLLELNRDWLIARLGRLHRKHARGWFPDKPPDERLSRGAMGSQPWHYELDGLLWRLRAEHPTEFKRLEKMIGAFTPERARLSALHVLEPLLEHSPSWCVERAGHELEPREFAAFVRAGLTRERILLRRAAAPQRILQAQRDIGMQLEREEREIAAFLKRRQAQREAQEKPVRK